MRRIGVAVLVACLVGCAGDGGLEAAARAYVVEMDAEYGPLARGFAPSDVVVVESFVDGDCAGVHVIEPDHEGWSGEMTVFLRRSGGTWGGTAYVTGHVADRQLGESTPDCRGDPS